MKLKEILKDIPECQVKGSAEILISGISANSKMMAPGHLFIAKKGKTFDGSHFIHEALQSGAIAIAADRFDPSLEHVVQIIHPDISFLEGALAANYYRHPSRELLMVGMTGTNGKTTTSYLIKDLLDKFAGPCGLIGTIEYLIGLHRYQATRTTPDVVTNQKMLREMIKQGCRSAVMEVTSHALDQERVAKIDFDIAIFSNLTLDHLDYHGTMEAYGRAKRKLFDNLGKEKIGRPGGKWAIVNQDSSWSQYMLQGCLAKTLTYGIDQTADLQASNICLGQEGTKAQISYQGQKLACTWSLAGRFNVYNCLAAMAVALTQEIPLEAIVDHMSHMKFVRGRLQPVDNCLGLKIYVDFAHSDDALLNVLATLKEILPAGGRLIAVFGCGGDRDRSKRPKMAEACEKYADRAIVTSDNPRSENPQQICQEIIAGFSKSAVYEVECDRKAAIQRAIEMAGPEDLILIAGKGHETYQIFADKTIEFDDCKVAAVICTQLASHPLHT